jgi:hypothetical protein
MPAPRTAGTKTETRRGGRVIPHEDSESNVQAIGVEIIRSDVTELVTDIIVASVRRCLLCCKTI